MTECAESGASRGPVYNSIACDLCRQRKRRCDRRLPCCLQCAHDPSKCRYPEENKRGLPPGFTAKLEARLAETEAALFQVLSGTHFGQATAWSGDTPLALSSVSTGNQSKADRVKEWGKFPMRSRADLEAWFRWKSAVASPDNGRHLTTEPTGAHDSSSQALRSCWASEAGDVSSPDQPTIIGSATCDTDTQEQTSSRATELSRSQRNIYF